MSTKVSLPRLRSPRVMRRSLLDRLDAGLPQKLTLLSAPAGFGKSTLAAEWAERITALGEVSADLKPANAAAWVSLDEGDNDPMRFWRYVFTAIQSFDAEAGSFALELLYTAQQTDIEAVLTGLINTLSRRSGKAVLILEDYHLITNPQIHEAITFLLNHLPPALHLVILTRSDPALPLARLRARNEVNELRAGDLRFTEAEILEFVGQTLPEPLSAEMSARLAERTEGWPAGLRLAALALQGKPDCSEQEHFLDTFTGSHRTVLEYLVADVLASQSEQVQTFLLETSLLSRLSASLCDAVTGRSDSAAILEQLERANLFLEPIDGTGQWYRFHALFAEAMRFAALQRLGKPRLNELANNASRWYEAHDLNCEAVEAALFAEAFERAAGLIEAVVAPRLVGNEYHTLLRWMQNLPEDVLQAHPVVCMTFAQAILFTSGVGASLDNDRPLALVAMAEQVWSAAGNEDGLGKALALRALFAIRHGDYSQSFGLARQALERLPEDEIEWRGVCLTFTGFEEYLAGQTNTALRSLTEARALLQTVHNIYGLLNATIALGEVHALKDEPQQAAELFRLALIEGEHAPIERVDKLRRRGRALLGLAALALDRDDLENAEQGAAQALAIGRELGSEDLLVNAECLQARVLAARGQIGPASERLNALIARVKQPRLLGQARFWQTRLALAAGDLASAQRWAAGQGRTGNGLPALFQEKDALLLARLQIIQGDAEAALRRLEPWLADAQANGRTRSEVEIRLLMAQAEAVLERWPQARQAIIDAITAAEPHNFLRIYLDEGEPLAALLGRLAAERLEEPLGGSVRTLLRALNRDRQDPGSDSLQAHGAAVEPLSQQEQRVLRLLAGGLSNPEIADELVVSVNTVKTHVKSIYRKLNVSSRSEVRAATRGSSLYMRS